jgi:hypothetical protein
MRAYVWVNFQKGIYTVHLRPLDTPLQGCIPLHTVPNGRRGTVHGWYRRLCADLRPRKHVLQIQSCRVNFSQRRVSKLANVDVIANMCDTEGSTGPVQTAIASVSIEQAAMKFNENFLSWRDARDKYTWVSNWGTSHVWARVKLVGEDETKPFQLCCRKCGASCQLENPTKCISDHSQSACDRQLKKSAKGGARTAGLASQYASVRGAGMNTFAASKDQQETFIDNLVKAMVTNCIPFTFTENEYLRRAAASVGVQLPSRKVVAGTLLDRTFE